MGKWLGTVGEPARLRQLPGAPFSVPVPRWRGNSRRSRQKERRLVVRSWSKRLRQHAIATEVRGAIDVSNAAFLGDRAAPMPPEATHKVGFGKLQPSVTWLLWRFGVHGFAFNFRSQGCCLTLRQEKK